MDNFILEVINIHNLGSNKKNHTKFLESLRQVESINENQEIYQRTKEGIDNEEIYRYLRDINSIGLNKMNNNDKYKIKDFLKQLKQNIIDLINNLMNIYNYQTSLIKKIDEPVFFSKFGKPLVWKELKNLDFNKFLRGKYANNTRNVNKENINTLIFNRIAQIFIDKKIEPENTFQIEFIDKGQDKEICNLLKNIQGYDISMNEIKNNLEKIGDEIEIKNFIFKENGDVVFKDYQNILKSEKDIYLFFLLILEVTQNISEQKGNFNFFKNITDIEALYKSFHEYSKKLGHKKKDQSQKKGKKKKGKGKKGKQTKKGGGDGLPLNKLRKQSKKSKKEEKKNKKGDKNKGKQKSKEDKVIKNFDVLTSKIKYNIEEGKSKSLKKYLDNLKVYQYTLYNYENKSYIKKKFNELKEIKRIADSNSSDGQMKKKIKEKISSLQELQNILCEDDKQAKDTNTTFNIFNAIFSDNQSYEVTSDDMVKGRFRKIDTFLLPYSDENGIDIKEYLTKKLTKEKLTKIISGIFNLYSGLLYIQLNYLITIYTTIYNNSIIKDFINKNSTLDLLKKNKNSNKNSNKNKISNKNSNKNKNNNNKTKTIQILNNNLMTTKEINKNIIKLKLQKEKLNDYKLSIIHSNNFNNETRNKALNKIDSAIDKIIKKLEESNNN
jgi:hypothetical protein